MVRNATPKDQRVMAEWMVPFYSGEYSKSYISTPRSWGGYSSYYAILDEWDSFIPSKIDQTRLQDDTYLQVLREQVLERISK